MVVRPKAPALENRVSVDLINTGLDAKTMFGIRQTRPQFVFLSINKRYNKSC